MHWAGAEKVKSSELRWDRDTSTFTDYERYRRKGVQIPWCFGSRQFQGDRYGGCIFKRVQKKAKTDTEIKGKWEK